VKRIVDAAWTWLDTHRFPAGLLTGGVVGVVIGAVTVALLPGPGGGAEQPTTEPLVILSGRDESDGEQRQKLIDQWNATHAQKARIVSLPSSADDAHAAMLEYAQARTNRVDIYNLDVTWIAEFAEAGHIVPVPSGAVDRTGFLDKPLETCEYDGKLWALPFNTDAGLLYYRTDLGVDAPRSQIGIGNAVDRVAARPADQRTGIEAGYVGQLGAGEWRTVNALEAIWAAGGEVVTRDGRVVLRSEEAQTGLRWLAAGLSERDPLPLVLPDSRGYDEGQSTQAFAEGRAVFMRNWPVAYRVLAPSGAPTPRVRFDTTTLPGGISVLGGQNLAVSSRSARPAAARQLIAFLTSERSQQILFERGGLAATRRIVYLDDRIRERYPYAATLLAAIESARPRPVTPHYVRFSEVFREVVAEALGANGQITDDQISRLEEALDGRR
jgi:multiple sugar transport system substrate-binding protein